MPLGPVGKMGQSVLYQVICQGYFLGSIRAEIVIFLPERHHMAKFPGTGEKAVVLRSGNSLIVEFVPLGVQDVDQLLPAEIIASECQILTKSCFFRLSERCGHNLA